MPTLRQVLITASVATAVTALARIGLTRARRTRSNRLFFYAVKPWDPGFQVAKAAVATIGPGHFEIESEYSFGDWSFVVNAASGGKQWLFFHNYTTGAAATGWIDDNYNVRNARYYPPGFVDFPYQVAGVDGRGYLLLVGYGAAGKTVVGFAQVLDDGTFVEWWRTELSDFPFPREGSIAGLKDSHAWFTNDDSAGGGSTVYLFDAKHAQILSSRKWNAPVRMMVADGDLIFLSFGDPIRTSEICVVDSNHQLVTIKRTEFDFDFDPEAFDRVASTPGAHLLYSYQSFTARGEVRVLSHQSFKVTKTLTNMDWRWHFVVRC